MNIGCEDDELKPYVESEPELNDQRRIDALAALGLPREEIEESLRNRKYDDVMANYLLLGKRLSEADQSDSRSSSSLSLRGLRPPLEVAASNGQSPAHVKVQRSVSATTKPRRFSHGGDSQNQNAVSTSGNSSVSGSSYKRQNTLDVVKEKPENSTGNGPPSPSNKPSSKPTTASNVADNSPTTPVLNTTKITGIGSLRQTQKTTTPSPLTLKNTFSGIPRRNTYNYSENKSSSAEKTTLPELPVRFVSPPSITLPMMYLTLIISFSLHPISPHPYFPLHKYVFKHIFSPSLMDPGKTSLLMISLSQTITLLLIPHLSLYRH